MLATANISTKARRRRDWGPRAYGAGLNTIKLIDPPIGIGAIKKRIPKLAWANYPRSVTTPSPNVAAEIRRLIGRHAFETGSKDSATDIELILKDRRIRTKTTRRALIEARLGQGKFRTDLIKRWCGACAATGCRVPDVLGVTH